MAKLRDRTPWFKGTTTPARTGPFEHKMPRRKPVMFWWDGFCWRWTVRDAQGRLTPGHPCLYTTSRPWRGLIKEASNA